MTVKKNQKTNILYILNSSSGGATQGIIELLSAIDRNSIEPFIITPNSPNKNQEKLFRKYSKEVEVIRMDWWNKKYDTRLTKRIIQSLSSILKTALNLITVYKIIRKIRQWDIDIIHTSTALTMQGALSAKLTNTPHIWHIRENIGSKGLFKFWFPDHILIKIFNYLSDYITPESYYAGQLFFKNQYDKNKLIVTYDGVDCSQYDNPNLGNSLRQKLNINDNKNLLVGMVANLSATMKRHDIFIKVASLLSKKYPETIFVIFGSEPTQKKSLYNDGYIYANSLKVMVKNLDMGSQFIWGGFQQNIPELMSALDILIHPCEVEGFGRIAIEAMAAGKPVIGPTSGGVSETVKQEVTGILVSPGSVNEFSKATEKLIVDSELRKRLGSNGRIRAEKEFSLNNHVYKLTELYDNIMTV